VPRWRWWIHFALIGGYILPGVVRGLYFVPEHPVLTRSTRGLLIVCGFNLAAFCCRVFARLARFSRHRRRIISAVASGLVGVTVGHRLLDRASGHSGRHWYHHDPLSLGHALGGRELVAERSVANSPKDRSPRGFFRVADEPPLLLVGANAGQFRRCGLARGIVARRDVNRNAGTLATGISVDHLRGYCDHRNRNWFWRRSFVDGSSCCRGSHSTGTFFRNHSNRASIDLASRDRARFFRCDHVCPAASGCEQASATAFVESSMACARALSAASLAAATGSCLAAR